MVAPVVVNPEVDSKTALVSESPNSGINKNGSAPNSASTTQKEATIINPSCNRISVSAFFAGNQRAKPKSPVIAKEATKIREVVS